MKIEVFVVSLKNATARRSAIQSQLDKLNVPFRFIDAINGREIPKEKLIAIQSAQRSFRDYNRNLGPGEIGCTLSHEQIYRQTIERDLDAALALEDDVFLEPSFAEFFHALKNLPPQDFEVILLGGGEYKEKHVNKNYYSWLKKSKGSTPIPGTNFKIHKIVSGHKYAVRTCGYFISRNAARNLCLFSPHNKTLADDWKTFFNLGVLKKIDIIQPYLLKHPLDISDSTIQADRLANNKTARKISFSQNIKRLCGVYHIKYCAALIAHKIKGR